METNHNPNKTIIFVDIRGFSKASTVVYFHQISQDLILDYYKSIAKIFPDDFIKYMGDGAMIVSNLTDISEILGKCTKIREEFLSISKKHAAHARVNLSLSLGFGITAGIVQEIQNPLSNKHIVLCDYLSPRINLASRLCSLAHPDGIIIHDESFPDSIPEPYSKDFNKEIMIGIKGFDKDEIRCWVEKKVKQPEPSNAKIVKVKSEFHVTGFCFVNNKLLMEKRSDRREIDPSKWSSPGGKIKAKMTFEDGLKKKFKDETGLNIKNIILLGTYYINDLKIPGIIYYCESDETELQSSGILNDNYRLFQLDELIELKHLLPNPPLTIKQIKKAFERNFLESRIRTRLRIKINHECNYNCLTCHKDNVRKEIKTVSIKEQLNSFTELRKIFAIDTVTITGGEPFINDEIWNVIRFLRKNDDLIIKVVTNGSTITDEIIEKIVSHNIGIKISIYGFSDQTAKLITQKEQKGYFYKIVTTIKKLHEKNVNFTVNILMNSHIEKEIDQIISAIYEINNNVSIKIIDMVCPIDKQWINLYKPIDNNTPYHTWKYICCNDEQCEKTCFGKWGLTILPNGEIQLCEKTPSKIMDVLNENGVTFNSVDYSRYNMNRSGIDNNEPKHPLKTQELVIPRPHLKLCPSCDSEIDTGYHICPLCKTYISTLNDF